MMPKGVQWFKVSSMDSYTNWYNTIERAWKERQMSETVYQAADADYVRMFIRALEDPDMRLITEKPHDWTNHGAKGKAAILAALKIGFAQQQDVARMTHTTRFGGYENLKEGVPNAQGSVQGTGEHPDRGPVVRDDVPRMLSIDQPIIVKE